MRLLQFVRLLQGILHNTIDEVEQSANTLTEETIEQDDDKIDIAAFDYIIKIITDMKSRYLSYKSTQLDDPLFEERVRTYNLAIEDDDEDEGTGGLH